jgi:hypothetical protein
MVILSLFVLEWLSSGRLALLHRRERVRPETWERAREHVLQGAVAGRGSARRLERARHDVFIQTPGRALRRVRVQNLFFGRALGHTSSASPFHIFAGRGDIVKRKRETRTPTAKALGGNATPPFHVAALRRCGVAALRRSHALHSREAAVMVRDRAGLRRSAHPRKVPPHCP